jgi:hypothetical protein
MRGSPPRGGYATFAAPELRARWDAMGLAGVLEVTVGVASLNPETPKRKRK